MSAPTSSENDVDVHIGTFSDDVEKRIEPFTIPKPDEKQTSSRSATSSDLCKYELHESCEVDVKRQHDMSYFFPNKKKRFMSGCVQRSDITTSKKILPENNVRSCTMASSDIVSWKTDEVFVNKRKCSLGPKSKCSNCMNLMFSSKYRGKSIADLEWFNDRFSDHVTSPKYKNIYSQIAYKYFFMLRKHERSLREISRKDVLDALSFRFRGFYNSEKADVLDEIMCTHHFCSIKEWCLWKQDLDYKFLSDYYSIKNKVLFCSGCGDKCITFQSSKTLTNYQKCSNNLCDFFHKEGSFYATVKKNPNANYRNT